MNAVLGVRKVALELRTVNKTWPNKDKLPL